MGDQRAEDLAPFDHVVDVVRPDDLLVLRFGFVNLAPSTDPARLGRVRPGTDAFVVVGFPLQHVQERAFDESAAGKEPLAPAPIAAAAAYPSRLAFRLPADQDELPLTLDALLGWEAWEPSLAANALPAAPTPEQLAARPEPAAPDVTETAIELPYRLMLSPLPGGRWTHRTDVADIDGRVELWHTRLAAVDDDGPTPDGVPQPVRAIWSPDLDPSAFWLRRASLDDSTLQSLDSGQRRQIVRLSSNFSIAVRGGTYRPEPARVRRLLLSALGGWLDVHGRWPVPDIVRLPDDLSPYITPSRPIDPDRLRSLVDLAHVERLVEVTGPSATSAEPIASRALERSGAERWVTELEHPIGVFSPKPVSLGEVAWIHRARQSRDEYVEFHQPGLLWPVGHLASLITITERKFEPGPSGGTGAYLRQRRFVQVTQPVRDYRRSAAAFPYAGRELPYRTLRFASLVTPDLDRPPDGPGEVPPPFFPSIGGTPHHFDMATTDHTDGAAALRGPLLFVPFATDRPIADSIAAAVPVWNGAPDAWKGAAVPGVPVAFAALTDGDRPGLTTATCHRIQWAVATSTAEGVPAGEAPVLPALREATVSVPALGRIAGPGAGAATGPLTYPTIYLQHGYGAGNPSHLFAAVGGLAATAAADRSGGVAAPSFTVQALSKALGPVADIAKVATGTFDPATFLPTAKLFGALSLKDLIDAVAPWADPGAVVPAEAEDSARLLGRMAEPGFLLPVPVLLHQDVLEGGRAVATETLYAWKPPIRGFPAGILSVDLREGAALSLTTVARTPIGGGESSSYVEGVFTRFDLVFAGVIAVQFDEFRFRSTGGVRMDVDVKGVRVEFRGALSFVQTIREILPENGFSDPPYLTVLPTGVTAGYTLAVPTLGVGVISIEGIALAAGVALPFTGDPAGVRFAISSRERPFLVTVALFGGGGFFAVGVNTAGPPQVEAAIEFGGNFSLDIGVASGNVHVMAGIYFAMLGSAVKLSGYLRMGGSVSVLGIITVSVEFYLALTYDNGKAYGEARISVSVEIFGFSQSVSLRVQKQFAGAAGDPTFGQLVGPADWEDYVGAFAEVGA